MTKGYKHLTKQQKAGIERLYQETQSTSITAERLGVNIQRARYYLKRRGIQLTGYRKTACHENFDLVVQLAQEGHSYSEIARQVGTNHHRVKEFLERYEIDHPGHVQTGKNNPNWKGGRVVDKDGYVLVLTPGHPNADRHGYMREHRLVMEEQLGRLLEPGEVVHHLDDDQQNNSPENLKLYPSNGEHLAETLSGQVPDWTEDGKRRIWAAAHQAAARKRKSSQSQS